VGYPLSRFRPADRRETPPESQIVNASLKRLGFAQCFESYSLFVCLRVPRWGLWFTFLIAGWQMLLGFPTAGSFLPTEMLGSDDCTGLNGAERRLLEGVLIHNTPAGLSPRLIPGARQSLSKVRARIVFNCRTAIARDAICDFCTLTRL